MIEISGSRSRKYLEEPRFQSDRLIRIKRNYKQGTSISLLLALSSKIVTMTCKWDFRQLQQCWDSSYLFGCIAEPVANADDVEEADQLTELESK